MNPSPPVSITLARFARAVKLGANELDSYYSERTPGWTVDATPQGLVFTYGKALNEVVVPWSNVVSYVRERRS